MPVVDSSLRLYALAKLLELPSKELLAHAQRLGMSYSSVHNSVSVQDANLLVADLQPATFVVEATPGYEVDALIASNVSVASDTSKTSEGSSSQFAITFLQAFLNIVGMEGEVTSEGEGVQVASEGWYSFPEQERVGDAVQQILDSAFSTHFPEKSKLQVLWTDPTQRTSRSMDVLVKQMVPMVQQQQRAVTLFCLNDKQRRLVHQCIAEHEEWGIRSYSEGNGIFRRVHLMPNDRAPASEQAEATSVPGRRPRPARRREPRQEQRNRPAAPNLPSENSPTEKPSLQQEPQAAVEKPSLPVVLSSPDVEPTTAPQSVEQVASKEKTASEMEIASEEKIASGEQRKAKELSREGWINRAVFGVGFAAGVFVTLLGVVVVALLQL